MKRSPVKISPCAKHGRSRAFTSYSRMLVSLALLQSILSPDVPIWAQETNSAQPIHRLGSRHKRQSLDERIELLDRYLDMNEKQRSTLKGILLERQQEIVCMRRAPSAGNVLQMDRVRAIEEKTAERIRAMLNEEQRQKYDPFGVRKSSLGGQNVNVEEWLRETGPR